MFEQLLRPEIIWVLIPLAALAIPIVAITGGFVTGTQKSRRDAIERAEARRLYERIAMEKLDIVKTAISMGYKTEELAALDARLAMLVGEDKMEELIGTGKSARKSGHKTVKVSITSDQPITPTRPRVPQSASADTLDELLLRDGDLMDSATLDALSKEFERRRKAAN